MTLPLPKQNALWMTNQYARCLRHSREVGPGPRIVHLGERGAGWVFSLLPGFQEPGQHQDPANFTLGDHLPPSIPARRTHCILDFRESRFGILRHSRRGPCLRLGRPGWQSCKFWDHVLVFARQTRFQLWRRNPEANRSTSKRNCEYQRPHTFGNAAVGLPKLLQRGA